MTLFVLRPFKDYVLFNADKEVVRFSGTYISYMVNIGHKFEDFELRAARGTYRRYDNASSLLLKLLEIDV